MPSRKRAKGKERKLKQQARQSVSSSSPPPAVGNNISLPEQNIPRIEEAKNNKCGHGGFILPRGHPVNNFINTFQEVSVLEDGNINMPKAMSKTFKIHEDVWKDSKLRKIVINIMLSIGTSFLLDDYYIGGAEKEMEAIIFLENYNGEGTFDSAFSKAAEDYYYTLNAEERDIVYFYKKRIPCSCLDKLYSEIKKKQDRGSQCHRCRQTVKRKDLKICSRCKCGFYCSKECQISDWPTHKEWCKGMCSLHDSV